MDMITKRNSQNGGRQPGRQGIKSRGTDLIWDRDTEIAVLESVSLSPISHHSTVRRIAILETLCAKLPPSWTRSVPVALKGDLQSCLSRETSQRMTWKEVVSVHCY